MEHMVADDQRVPDLAGGGSSAHVSATPLQLKPQGVMRGLMQEQTAAGEQA